MQRADRLLQIIQVLRRSRSPVTAQMLATELEVSRRTIYRDILDLQTSLVPIEGEAGIGYVLRPGYDLPPLMFTVEEVEAIVLGTRLVRSRADADLARASDDVLAKISAVLPSSLAAALQSSALLVPTKAREQPACSPDLASLRLAVRERVELRIAYTDASGASSGRSLFCSLPKPRFWVPGANCARATASSASNASTIHSQPVAASTHATALFSMRSWRTNARLRDTAAPSLAMGEIQLRIHQLDSSDRLTDRCDAHDAIFPHRR